MAKFRPLDAANFAIMLGGNLKYCRLSKAKFIPQKVLAGHLSVSPQQINKYEAGKNIPCTYRLTQIANFYKVKLDDLVSPNFIFEQTKNNQILTPQDAGYLKPQKDIGSYEELKGVKLNWFDSDKDDDGKDLSVFGTKI